jgi:hypothetical protein
VGVVDPEEGADIGEARLRLLLSRVAAARIV